MPETKTRTRKPKTTSFEELSQEIEKLKKCLSLLAHMTGQQRVTDRFGIERYELDKTDMGKYNK